MSDIAVSENTFAAGRYSKRKRTQVTYVLDELEVSDSESDYETPQAKKPKARASKPLPKRNIFPFMKLPAEIRNMIYGFALTDPSGINLVATFKHKRRTVERVTAEAQATVTKGYYHTNRLNDHMRAKYAEPIALAPSLLAVSKQIHQEGKDVLYGNEFVFADTFALYSFLINLGPSGAKHLKSIRLLGWGYGRAMKAYNHACFAPLVWATSLSTFHVDTAGGWYRNSKSCAEQIYRDAFPWLESVGREKGKVDAGVDVLKLNPSCFQTRYWNGPVPPANSGEAKVEEFKAALSKLLGLQQKRLLAKPVKKRKIAKGVVTDEL